MTLPRSALAVAAMALVPLTQAWNVELPPCLEPFKPFVASGCFQDGNPNALVFRSSLDQQNMTVEKCVAECKGNGFRYAGLKYYGVCFCGSTVNGAQVDDSQCTLPCTGDKTETCGGDNTLSVWQDPTFPKGPNDVTVDDYKSLGCYTDDSQKGRTLSYPIDLDAATFTPKTCLAACEKMGFPFAGTEYGKECWCGVVLANDTAKVADTDCNIPCQGDTSQNCGGRSRLSLYVAKDLESLEPCGGNPGESTTSQAPPQTTTTTTNPGNPETSTTSQPGSTEPCTTTTPGNPETSTTSKPGNPGTSTTSKPSSTEPCTTSKPGNPPTTTTTKQNPHTTTSLCTATVTIPPTCEWKCGNWCAPPVPGWGDQNGCVIAQKTCQKQVSSCFKNAGWPGSVECFKFKAWCEAIDLYCHKFCPGNKCGKDDCWNWHHGGKPPGQPSTSTTVYPCPATKTSTTTTKPPATSCPPGPTSICTQPSNSWYGYCPGKPVGGIALPIVGCNDIKSEFDAKPFKYYSDAKSENCRGFPWNQWPNVCADACKEQYTECVNTYAKGCKDLGWKDGFHKRWSWGSSSSSSSSSSSNGVSACAVAGVGGAWAGTSAGADASLCWGWGGNSPNTAILRCEAQYKDCLKVNQWVNPKDKCKQWCGC